MKSYLLSLIFILGLQSCATLSQPLVEPKVDLQNVDVTEPTTSEATLIFNFLVNNPNAVAINLDQVTYDLTFNGKPFTNGVIDKGLSVEANSSTTIPLPIRVKYSDLFTSVSHLVSFGATPYHLKGTAKMGILSIPFEKTGEVKLAD